MRAPISMAIAIALVGCGNEAPIRQNLPVEEPGQPLSLDASVTQQDLVLQVAVPSTDILFVVDNSCSMGDDQEALVDNFPTFMRWFLGSGLDYHIGVVSTDVYDPAQSGKLVKGFSRKWISADDNNQVNMFNQMAVLGVSGSGDERGTDALYMALEEEVDEYNAGFYRDEAALHTIAVSDEPDYSRDLPFGELVNWYDTLKRTADDRTFSAIERRGGAGGGSSRKYGDMTARIGGVIYDINETSWDRALDALGLRATGMKTEYFLSKLPVDETISVRVREPIGEGEFTALPIARAWLDSDGKPVDAKGEPISSDPHWYYLEGRNSIVFIDFVPEEQRTVEINYTVRSSVTN